MVISVNHDMRDVIHCLDGDLNVDIAAHAFWRRYVGGLGTYNCTTAVMRGVRILAVTVNRKYCGTTDQCQGEDEHAITDDGSLSARYLHLVHCLVRINEF